jgi:hypothetical protein
VLLNQDEKKGRLMPNANVNIEYGLMLGFNKYLIPFQREKHVLPFNVAGLHTVKYADEDFEKMAAAAIDVAVAKTSQDSSYSPPPDQIISIFLLSKKLTFANIQDPGEKNIFLMGSPFGFSLLNDFSGMVYHFFGNFTAFRSDAVMWRLRMLNDLLNARRGSIKDRVEIGIAKPEQAALLETFFSKLKVIILVTGDEDKTLILQNMAEYKFAYDLEIYSLGDMRTELEKLTRGLS